MIRSALLLLASLVLACDPVLAGRPSAPLTGTLAFRAGFFDQNDAPLANDRLPRAVLLRLSFIGGALFGNVTTPPVASITAPIGGAAALDLADIRAKAARAAAPLTRRAAASGLVMAPRDARLARLATTVYHPQTKKGVGDSVFRDIATHESLVMVYFDRPCRLGGIVRGDGAEVAYDVKVDRAGLRWLTMVRESPTRYRVTLSEGARALSLSILP